MLSLSTITHSTLPLTTSTPFPATKCQPNPPTPAPTPTPTPTQTSHAHSNNKSKPLSAHHTTRKYPSSMTTQNDAASTSPPKKPHPIPWTHQETVHLIRAYQEKWYALKRGPLRHNQWEEVAVVVAARCGYDLAHPSKSALQCRHKMEKLRQRHRAEKKLTPTAIPATWQYNALMDDLERGPLPISARAPLNAKEEEEEDTYQSDNDCNQRYYVNVKKSKSINCIIGERTVRMRNNNDRAFLSEHAEEEEEVEEEEDEDNQVMGLSAEMRAFAERFIGMESLKMEMMKETERCRLEMEEKRIQMIVESQRRIVDSIGRAFGSNKRVKITQQI